MLRHRRKAKQSTDVIERKAVALVEELRARGVEPKIVFEKADSFQPPQAARDAAARGLELRREFGRGGTEVGIARARDIAGGKGLPLDTVRRMKAFFDRHGENKNTPPEEGNGKIAWLLWGGDPGRRWAEKIIRREPVEKGLVFGAAEAGSHAHGLDWKNGKTSADGWHRHLWYLPDGSAVFSDEDGVHAHAFVVEGVRTEDDGAHAHLVPDIGETKLGGSHGHELLFETTGFGGVHQHALILEDGTEIMSALPRDEVFRRDEAPAPVVAPPASQIAQALIELEGLRSTLRSDEDELPDLEVAVERALEGEELEPPTYTVEDDEGLLVDVTGEVVAASEHVLPDDEDDVAEVRKHWELISRHTTRVPPVGSEDARLLFLSGAPNELELARREALVGEDAITFVEKYLAPIGVDVRDVAKAFVMPVVPHEELTAEACVRWAPALVDVMKAFPRARVVALGRVAREVLKTAGVEHWSMPHPSAVRRFGDSGEVGRKITYVAKALDLPPPSVSQSAKNLPGANPALAEAIREIRSSGSTRCRVIKSDDAKRIVYGVVLDPYVVDLQGEWVPPADVESTAHGFLKRSRVIGLEHTKKADASLVESWVEVYPSPDDYKAALAKRPHRVLLRKFGDDWIHSGTWMAGVQLGPDEWEMYRRGDLGAFSVGGFSFKTTVTTEAMPKVETIRLVEEATP